MSARRHDNTLFVVYLYWEIAFYCFTCEGSPYAFLLGALFFAVCNSWTAWYVRSCTVQRRRLLAILITAVANATVFFIMALGALVAKQSWWREPEGLVVRWEYVWLCAQLAGTSCVLVVTNRVVALYIGYLVAVIRSRGAEAQAGPENGTGSF